MKKGKGMAAESLGAALSVASTQKQSGLLRVESLQNISQQKGELYILAGQPLYARVGKLSGQEAFDQLLTWHPIFYSLELDAPRPPANLGRVRNTPSSPLSGPLSGPLPPIFQNSFAARENGRGSVGGSPAPQSPIPHKNGSEQRALSLPLTHRQRLVYFLVDGQRTVTDLSRCSGRSAREIEEILTELQQQGLIVIVSGY